MRRVLYSKYNRTRAPKFQTETKIVEIDNVKWVEKKALTKEAKEHIAEYNKKYEINKKLYSKLIPLEGKYDNDTVSFPYVTGKSVTSLLTVEEGNISELFKKINYYLDLILDYNKEFLCEFENTKEFVKVFGNRIDFPCKAVKMADIDIIFDNVIFNDEQWYTIDYEWTFDFPIPLEYIKYRMLLLYYQNENEFLHEQISLQDFMKQFGISEEHYVIYEKLEEGFQQYVFGKNYKYNYPGHYQKGVCDLQALMDQYDNLYEIVQEGQGKVTQMSLTLNHKNNLLAIIENEKIKLEQEKQEAEHRTQEVEQERQKLQQQCNVLIQQKAEVEMQRNQLAALYQRILSSPFWRISKPIRVLLDKCYLFVRGHKITQVPYDGIRYFIKNGFSATCVRMKELYGKQPALPILSYELSEEEKQKQRDTSFEYQPKISILVPLYNTPEKFLREMIESVTGQTYSNWELCLADGSDEKHSFVEKMCKNYMKSDDRIRYTRLTENRGISENTNACVKMAQGDYIALFDHDDLLTQDALYEVVKRINEKKEADVVYTDEDKYLYDSQTGSGTFVEPHFKSDFNMDLFRTNNYICHFFVVRKQIVDKIGGFRKEYDGSQDYDFIFRCVEQARQVEHIPKILYHWRIHANSTAANPQNKMYCYESGKKAIEAHFERMGIEGVTVEMMEHLGFYRVKYPVQDNPLVSIIIPNKDEKETLEKCINSIQLKTTYPNYEIIIVENNSETEEIFEYYEELKKFENIKVVYWKEKFNYSKINNFGVKNAKGEYLVLLNNDVEILSDGWMEELLSNCQRPEVGITGVKLLYPDDTVQHCGVVIGLGGIAGHAFVGLNAKSPGYFGRALIQQNLSAVTAACFMVSRKVFDEVNGLEEELQVAFNDVDFCLKVRKAGYLVVMNPNVCLYHYESKTRGAEDTPEKQERFQKEIDYMVRNWPDILKHGDPYYNPNLTLVRGDFSVKAPDEISPKYV